MCIDERDSGCRIYIIYLYYSSNKAKKERKKLKCKERSISYVYNWTHSTSVVYEHSVAYNILHGFQLLRALPLAPLLLCPWYPSILPHRQSLHPGNATICIGSRISNVIICEKMGRGDMQNLCRAFQLLWALPPDLTRAPPLCPIGGPRPLNFASLQTSAFCQCYCVYWLVGICSFCTDDSVLVMYECDVMRSVYCV